jgi:hypothetical protein
LQSAESTAQRSQRSNAGALQNNARVPKWDAVLR